MLVVDGFTYNGPFFISCDHGCFHGEGNHGLGVISVGCGTGNFAENGEEPTRQFKRHDVIKKCTSWIKNSDIIFVWLNKRDAYGTIAEIGIAHTFNKPIFIGISNQLEDSDDMWFVINLANYYCFEESVVEAWKKFVTLKSKLIQNKNLIDDHKNAKVYQIQPNIEFEEY
ncbi:hypothetical protein HMSSN036_67160 [Paenibacillus macerans]|nr:hypothetical protein HMSSN036_67160 [Paenibacillus macerans]